MLDDRLPRVLPASDEPSGNGDNRKQLKTRGRAKIFGYGFITGVVTIIAVAIIAFNLGVFTTINSFLNPKPAKSAEPVVTSSQIAGIIKDASELTTARYIYSGIVDIEEGTIPVINRSSFAMYYTAIARAGITDLSNTQVEVTGDQVIITLPPSKILDVHVNPSSLRFFTTEKAWFHTNDRNQVKAALEAAETSVASADMTELLNLADEQLDKLFQGLLEGYIGNHELVIKHEDRVDSTARDATIDSDGDDQSTEA